MNGELLGINNTHDHSSVLARHGLRFEMWRGEASKSWPIIFEEPRFHAFGSARSSA